MSQWPMGRLDSVAVLDRQSIHPSEAVPESTYLGLEHLDGEGGVNCIETVDSAGLKSNKFQFTKHHVLFGKLRPYLRKIARPEFSGICSTDIIPILPKDGLSRDYLFYFLRTPETVELATSRCSGANLPRLSPKQLASFLLPLPPLAEQQRIARVLDAADALRATRRESLAQLDTLLQAAFLDLFGDPVRGDKCLCSDLAVSDRGTFSNGPFGSHLLSSELTDEGIPVVYIRDIRDGEYLRVSTVCVTEKKAENLEACQILPGDVLIAKVGDPPGTAAIYPTGEPLGVITQDVIRIRPDKKLVLPEFIVGFLNSNSGKHLLSGITVAATRSRFSLRDLKGLTLTVPPLDLQHHFAQIVESVEHQKATQRAHLAELDTLFASLQARAFRGDL